MLNPFQEVNWEPGRAEKRKFALSLMAGFPAIAAIFSCATWLAKHAWKPFFLWLAAIGFALGLVLWLLPSIAKPFYLLWYFIGCCAGIVIGNILLGAFFYLVVTPLGLALRLVGWKPISKGFDRRATSYWHEVKKQPESRSYYRQF